jgi:hypothetical protein
MSRTFKPAEVFHPGEFLRDELSARGWTQGDLAKVIDRPLGAINEIINEPSGRGTIKGPRPVSRAPNPLSASQAT